MSHAQQPSTGSRDPFRDPSPPPPVPKRSIIVENRTGNAQKYFCFADEVFQSNWQKATIRMVSNVASADDQQTAQFDFPLGYKVIHGIGSGEIVAGVTLQIVEARDVELGNHDRPGTAVGYDIQNGVPKFNDAPGGSQGLGTGNGGFEIRVSEERHFTSEDVWKGHFFIGVGIEIQDRGVVPLWVTPPEPSLTYTIGPGNSFTFATGDHQVGAVIEADALANTCVCDFKTSNNNTIKVTHNQDGTYTRLTS